ncbi:MAG: sugar transferase [Patescibacteria group bacterium]|nr:sugar transferase [Patescibacteria group bacterium]
MTKIVNSKAAAILVAGDLIAYLFSLILTLTIRYAALPGRSLIYLHLESFGALFLAFVLVNFAAGLYDRGTASARQGMPGMIFKAQLANAVLGVAYFYLVPTDIAPKSNLALFLVISTLALYVWRLAMFPVFSAARKQAAVLVGAGKDVDDLQEEIDSDARYGLAFKEAIDPGAAGDLGAAIGAALARTGATVVVADFHDRRVEEAMPRLYSLMFSGAQIIDAGRLYESVFGRVPTSMVGERWFVENSAAALGSRRVYDVLKRAMDVAVAGLAGIVSLAVYPFVIAAIKIEDGGPIFVVQTRVGKGGAPITVRKFRSMSADDGGAYGAGGQTKNRVTRVGRFIRLTRIDEFPQFWSIVAGSQSLIGPRPELPSLVEVYSREIPYYNVRHLIKPGLSGWAQISHRAHPHHHVAVDDTRDKLSYDLYYIKNRSFLLDVRIVLQTLKAQFSKQGV